MNTVLFRESNYVCDFDSSQPIVATVHAVGDVQTLGMAEVLGFESSFSKDWAACSGCLPLIKARDWNGLADRAMAALVNKHGGAHQDSIKIAIMALYRAAFEGTIQIVEI